MDIYCGRCGEPTDPDALHDVIDATSGDPIPYETASRRFRAYGCGALEGYVTTTCEKTDNPLALMAQAAMDLSDHPDDWASDLDDLRALEGI